MFLSSFTHTDPLTSRVVPPNRVGPLPALGPMTFHCISTAQTLFSFHISPGNPPADLSVSDYPSARPFFFSGSFVPFSTSTAAPFFPLKTYDLSDHNELSPSFVGTAPPQAPQFLFPLLIICGEHFPLTSSRCGVQFHDVFCHFADPLSRSP